jgi:flagellar biosynthesis/type III secretory pathway M-ring protein FliF/YscJ
MSKGSWKAQRKNKLSGTPNIRGYSWRATEIVLNEAKRELCRMKSLGLNAPESTHQLEEAIKRVNQMLKEEPERFMEI